MKPTLVIRLLQAHLDDDTSLQWSLVSGQGTARSGCDPARDVLEAAGTEFSSVLVIVPAELVLLSATEIPSRQTRQIRQALPYMVEELVADEIEAVHIAIPAVRDEAGFRVPVAVIRHRLLVQWLDVLYRLGIRPDFLGPETLAVPWQQGQWNLLLDGSRVLLRRDAHAGQAVAIEHLDVLLDSLASESPPAGITVNAAGDGDGEELQRVAEQLRQRFSTDVRTRRFREPLLDVLASAAVDGRDAAINMLQGGYKVQNSRSSASNRWQGVAAVAAAGVLVYLLAAFGTGLYFHQRADNAEAEAVALYRELVPGARRVVSPRRQLESLLHSTSGAQRASFVALLTRAADPIAARPELKIDALRFDGSALRLAVLAPDVQSLDELKRALLTQGLGVEINSASEQGDAFLGRLSIEEI